MSWMVNEVDLKEEKPQNRGLYAIVVIVRKEQQQLFECQ